MSNTLSATHALTRLGFDIPRFNFALRTALASALAMTLAWLIGLEHPQWSAMTVWAVSQPVRGMLLEKSFFRAIGTLIGTLFGIMLVMLCGDNLPLMVVGLSLWVGLCVGASNLLSGLLASGTLLSGYSASMVALLNTQQPTGQIFLLGADRLATVLTGILVGLLVGLIFTPRRAEDELAGRVRRSTAQILQAMAARFAGTDSTPRAELAHQLLQDIAQTEQLFDTSAAGSLRSHRSIRGLRAMVQAQVGCVYWLRSARNLPANAELAAALERAAHAVADNAADRGGTRALEIGLALCAQDAVTSQILRQLLDSLRENAAMTDGNGDLATIRSSDRAASRLDRGASCDAARNWLAAGGRSLGRDRLVGRRLCDARCVSDDCAVLELRDALPHHGPHLLVAAGWRRGGPELSLAGLAAVACGVAIGSDPGSLPAGGGPALRS
ncbi:MAG TPA: FUSC family protein [Candidatus Pseudomonas excrementavium]|nr:FUSC family protein [Candidatus Pseudomonas excrementavium]